MSQSKESEGSSDTSQAHVDLSRMMKRGRSWSGRERHCAFLNLGRGADGGLRRFANISALSGVDLPEDGRALCLTDWDHDGDLDFWISNRTGPQLRFFRNEGTAGNHYLSLRLEGVKGNRDAIGARVEVSMPGEEAPLVKSVRAGDGFIAQSSKRLLFGLGGHGEPVRLTVHWPGGGSQVLEDVAVDRCYELREGNDPVPWSRPSAELVLAPSAVKLPESSSRARIPLVTLLHVPAVDGETFDGKPLPVRARKGRALLLNLWASWCAPCVKELKEFESAAGQFEEAGVDVVALAVDGVGEDGSEPAEAAAMAAKLKLPFVTGRVSPLMLTLFERLHARLTPTELELVVPMSLLIDEEGRLSVIYKGATSVEQVIADLEHAGRSRAERLVASGGLGGIALEASHPRIAEAANQLEVTQRFQFAQDVWQARQLPAAERQFLDTLALDPTFLQAANNLGLVYAAQGRHAEAIPVYRRALAMGEESATVHLNLGLSLDAIQKSAEARTHLERALAIDPVLGKANNALGLMDAKAGSFASARARFQRETEVNPEFADGYNHLGLIYLTLKQPEMAVAPLERAVSLQPSNADAFNNLGLALRQLGETERAGNAFMAAVRVAPRFVPALLNLGLHHLNRGELQAAELRFREALAIQPNSAMARQNLERLRRMRGN